MGSSVKLLGMFYSSSKLSGCCLGLTRLRSGKRFRSVGFQCSDNMPVKHSASKNQIMIRNESVAS